MGTASRRGASADRLKATPGWRAVCIQTQRALRGAKSAFARVTQLPMKAFLPWLAPRPSLLVLLAAQVVVVCGCTSALWDKETFAHHYRPAIPANLQLFYSKERRDILVQYDESKDGDAEIRPRCYWLDPNTLRVNRDRKPHYVSSRATEGLTPITVSKDVVHPTQPGFVELYAVAGYNDDFFTLYSGEKQLDPYKLPTYNGTSQRVKQVLLTPFAVGVDATIIGAVVACYSAPQIFAGLNR